MTPAPSLRPLLAALLVLAAACGPAAAPEAAGSSAPATAATGTAATGTAGAPLRPEGTRMRAVAVRRLPHDATAFTQGLEFDDGRLFESRGLYDEPVVLAEIDPDDGSAIREVPRDGDYFAEGLTVVDDRIVQITWREGRADVFDVDTLERIGGFTYAGEGWGICDQPDRLVMSDGSATLTFRDPATFEEVGRVEVTRDGAPVERLNELECIDGLVWANVWQTDQIVVVDPASGEVVSTVDASGLLTAEEEADADVLNGIAHDPATGALLLTGKLWPAMFEVRLECLEGCGPAVTPTHYRRASGGAPARAGT